MFGALPRARVVVGVAAVVVGVGVVVPAAVGGEHLEPDRPGQMSDDSALDRLDRSGHLADGAVGRRDHEQIDGMGRDPHVVGPAQRREHPPTHLSQRSGQ